MNTGQNRNDSGEGRSTRRKTCAGVILTKTTSTLTGGWVGVWGVNFDEYHFLLQSKIILHQSTLCLLRHVLYCCLATPG